MRPQSVTVSSQAASAALPVDYAVNPFNIGIGCVATGTLTYKVQFTFDNVMDSTVTATWFDSADLTGETTSQYGALTIPVRAVRLNVTAYTNGSVTMTLIQGRGN